MIRLAMVYPSWVKENWGEELLYSPLALAYLARHTPDHFEITLYDEYVGHDIDPDSVDADLVAISAITPGITRAYDIADRLRRRGITSVIGGAHASALPSEALQHCDSVCIGEGEAPWREFLADFEAGRPRERYFGPMNVSLAELGTPRREMCHPRYHYPSVLTSRGCPYSCSFCYLTVFKQRKYRVIPHETVLEDLERVKKSPIVIVTDENFRGYSAEDVEDRKILLEKMIRRKFRFVWGCQTTVGVADDSELMDLMYRAGCRAVFVGFEAIDDEGLKLVRKRHNVGVDYADVVSRINSHKIAVIASTILGLDSHEGDYHLRLIQELRRAKVDFVRVFYATAWPGTPLFDSLEKEGRANRHWDEVRKDVPSITFKHYTHEEAVRARTEILKTFNSLAAFGRSVRKWFLKEHSLFFLFLKMSVRIRIAEAVKRRRSY
jgi:radical SAM superfamily enzyme YgiQ (UPF0313 family)